MALTTSSMRSPRSPRSSLKSRHGSEISDDYHPNSSLNSSTKSVTFNDVVVKKDSTKPGRPCIKLIPNSNHNTNSTNNTTTSTSSATTCNAPPTYRASFSEASKSQKIVLSTLSTPATSHRTIQIVQATTRPPQGCEKRNSLLNWSATGSLPLISSNSSSDSQEYRKIIEQIHVICQNGKRPSLAVQSPTNKSSSRDPAVNLFAKSSSEPKTANQSAQTRSVRFDRRRPQTLELRRGSSRSLVEMDSYLMEEQKHLKRASVVIGVIATVIFLLCVAMVAVTLHFTPVMNQLANQRQNNASLIGQLPSAPASSIFDHPIVGFDNSKIQGGTDESAAKEDNNSAMVPTTTLTDDKITTTSTSNHQESSIIDITKDVEKKSSKKANQKAPHAQQQHKKSSSKTYTSYTLNAT